MVVQAAATIALGLLGLAGIAKVVDPQPTSGALTAARLPSSLTLVRTIGLVEFGAALVGLAIGSLAAIPGAVLYLGFTAFTWAALRKDLPIQSCGCFGREDTPPSWIHFWFNAVSFLALVSIALAATPTVPWGDGLIVAVAYFLFAEIGVFAAYLLLTALPQTLSVGR